MFFRMVVHWVFVIIIKFIVQIKQKQAFPQN